MKTGSNIHPKIKEPYILISHHNDMNVTQEFIKYLDDPKLFALFAQNCAIEHPKLIPIPIGLRSNCLFKSLAQQQHDTMRTLMAAPPLPKKYLFYSNFCIGTNERIRKAVFESLQKYPFCTLEKRKGLNDYLAEVVASKFVASPHGSGLDCYRTWEALYLGVYPVVKTSTLDCLYEGLPVLIITSWDELSEESLEAKFNEFQHTAFNWQRLDFGYWRKLVLEAQTRCRAKTAQRPSSRKL